MLLIVSVYLLILYASVFVLKTSVRVVAFAFIVAGYLPASHVIMKVAFTLAERTLFLPSFGASCLVVDLVYSATTKTTWQKLIMGLAVVCVFFVKQLHVKTQHTHFNTYRYAALTIQRNLDWKDERSLMESNLRVYPDFNYMSLFGLGALNLYSQNLSLGSKYLQGARDVALHFNQTYDFLVEDSFVLISEMIWKHHVDADGIPSESWREHAIETLDIISDSTRFRSLVMGNTGLLKYIGAQTEDELREAEYLVIAATDESMVQKSLALESQMLAMVYNNAACLRMISPTRRWGLGHAVEILLRGGIMQAKMKDDAGSRGMCVCVRESLDFHTHFFFHRYTRSALAQSCCYDGCQRSCR